MVKTLEELCLFLIARNLTSFTSHLTSRISRRHKEMLLERMCWHNLFTSELLPTISYHLFSDNLKRINFSHSDQINDQTMELLSLCYCEPLSLTINACPSITDKGLEVLSKLKLFLKIEYFKLSKLKHITGEGFRRLGSKSIKELVLNGCSLVRDKGFIDLIQKCPNVEILDISEMHKLTDTAIIAVAESLGPTLEELNCSENAQVTCESTLSLSRYCHKLKKATFDGCVKLDGSGLVKMAENCVLESLSISFCYKISPLIIDTLISTLKAKERLLSLDLMANTFGDFTVEFLASCEHLTHLFLAGVSITDKQLEEICSGLGEILIELDISGCPSLTDVSCKMISKHLICLEFLGMRNVRELTGTDLSPLFQDPVRALNFRHVAFSGSKHISPLVVEFIVTNCYNLETLLLAGLKDITDDVIVTLAHNSPHLTHCSVRNCQLTDLSICELAKCCNKLVMLALAGIHDLTDKCILALANNCPHMEELYVSGCTKITKQALNYLSDSVIKRMWLKHAVPNAPPGLLMAKDLDTGEYKRMD